MIFIVGYSNNAFYITLVKIETIHTKYLNFSIVLRMQVSQNKLEYHERHTLILFNVKIDEGPKIAIITP